MSEWQKIETAPKDGTDFLAACSFERKHHMMVGCFAPNGKFLTWPARIRGYRPTHWMPLPAPPHEEPIEMEDTGSLRVIREKDGRVTVCVRAPGAPCESAITLPEAIWLKMREPGS